MILNVVAAIAPQTRPTAIASHHIFNNPIKPMQPTISIEFP
ncbi:MAG: hypothetical protein V7L00_31855 [Nostoc sp.]